MRPPRFSAPFAAGVVAAAVAVAWPVTGQTPPADPPAPAAAPPPPVTAPRSILPEGFGPDAAPPTVAPPPVVAPPPPAGAATTADAAATDADAAIDPFDLPQATGAAIDVAGPLTAAMGGYGVDLFATADGRFVAGLVNRIRAPLASRWVHIVLRRALLSQTSAPKGLAPADWIAARAALLLRMGEADGAVALTDAVPVDRYSPALYRVAGQAHLAAADLSGLCPLAPNAVAVSRDPLWKLASGMCGAMTADDLTSAGVFDRLRDGDTVDPFDIQLAERVATVSGGAGRAANIDWDEAPRLTPYRFGVAVAAGVRVPDARLAGLGVAQSGWVLRAPGIGATARLAALMPAAALGIASAREMVSTIAASSVGLDGDALASSPAAPLATAFAATRASARLAALRDIRQARGSGDPRLLYAALIETALPAARIAPEASLAADAPDLVAALLSVGLEREALRWWAAVAGDDTAKAKVWGLLAAGGAVPVSPALFKAWQGTAKGDHRAALLLAGLAGLGRAGGSDWQGFRDDLGVATPANAWVAAIRDAAVRRSGGEVAVLAATALQCDWTAVPPAHFGAIVAAYVATGRAHEARLLVAEAVTRG